MKNTIRNTQYAILIALILAWFILPPTAQAAEYYLDADGVGEDGIIGTVDDVVSSDDNPGTAEQPWKTLARAYTWYSGGGSKVQEGDTVLFKDGNYGQFTEQAYTEATVKRRSDWVTYKAAPGQSPVLTKVYIHNQDVYGEVEDGNSYLIFDGFKIENTVAVYYTSYIQIKNCIVSRTPVVLEGYNAPYYVAGGAAIGTTSVDYFTVSDCNLYGSCFPIETKGTCSNHTYSRNELHHIGEDGIHFGGTTINALVEDNYIHTFRDRSTGIALKGTLNGTFQVGDIVTQAGTGAEGIVITVYSDRIGIYELSEADFRDPDMGGGIITGPNGITIDPFTDQDPSHTDGISLQGPTQTVTIRGNRIIGGALDGSGTSQGIKCDTQSSSAVIDYITIENNVVRSISSSLYISSVPNIWINNNTLSDNPDNGTAGARITSGHGNTNVIELYNNIIDDFCPYGDSGGYTNRVVSHGNNIFGHQPSGSGPTYPFTVNDSEVIVADWNALFNDPSAYDFTLAEDSAAIDFGNPAYSPATDLLGNPRDAKPDAGAYEYGASTFLYGDVNADGEISAFDAALAAHIAVDLEHVDIKNRAAAEVSGDGEVTAYDAALIAQRAVGLIDRFPVE